MAIQFNVPYLGGNELSYLGQVIENRAFAGNGPFTQRVQAFMEERYGVHRVLLTHSCTGAIEMVPLLLGIGPGDEVIVPSYTFSSTASGFARAGCKVVFCDVDPQTMMVDPDDVRKRITARTRLVMPIHYAGIACDLDGLLSVCNEHGVPMVEDAAQGLEAELHGKALGTFGPLGTMSFHETKNIHAGLAGALYINDPALAERAVYIWERGTNRQQVLRGVVDKYSWVEVGGSFYPSELQAAFLLAQLETLDRHASERAPLWNAYWEGFSGLADRGVLARPRIDPDRKLNHHAFFVVFPSFEECERVRLHLKAKEIAAYIGYVPLHSSKVGRAMGYSPEDLPITEDYSRRVLRMPLHHELTVQDVETVCREVGACFG